MKCCYVADTLAINEDNLSDNKDHICEENVLILKEKADDLDRLISIKEKVSQSKQDEQIQLLTLVPELCVDHHTSSNKISLCHMLYGTAI